MKAKGLEVQSHLWLQSKLEASLDYTDTILKQEERRKIKEKSGGKKANEIYILSLTLLEATLEKEFKSSKLI